MAAPRAATKPSCARSVAGARPRRRLDTRPLRQRVGGRQQCRRAKQPLSHLLFRSAEALLQPGVGHVGARDGRRVSLLGGQPESPTHQLGHVASTPQALQPHALLQLAGRVGADALARARKVRPVGPAGTDDRGGRCPCRRVHVPLGALGRRRAAAREQRPAHGGVGRAGRSRAPAASGRRRRGG